MLGAQNAEAAGTGIVLSSNGVVLTNNHVVAGATSINVTDIGNRKTYRAAVVGYDRSDDIAVLQLQTRPGLATATLGDRRRSRPATRWSPSATPAAPAARPSAVGGTVTALNQSITASDESTGSSEQLTGLIEINADIQAGRLRRSAARPRPARSSAWTPRRRPASSTRPRRRRLRHPDRHRDPIADQIRAGTVVQQDPHRRDRVPRRRGERHSGRGTGSPAPRCRRGLRLARPSGRPGPRRRDHLGRRHHGRPPDHADQPAGRYHPGDKVKVAWTDVSGQSHTGTVKLTTGPVG